MSARAKDGLREDTPGLSWAAALGAVQAAVIEAVANGIRVNAAVVDRGGNTLAFLRMPGAYLHSADLAVDKAYTAASFGFPTAAWPGVLESSPGLAAGMPARPRLVVFGGGLPLIENGECLGGIGVSGGSEAQDEACARAGLRALGLVAPD